MLIVHQSGTSRRQRFLVFNNMQKQSILYSVDMFATHLTRKEGRKWFVKNFGNTDWIS